MEWEDLQILHPPIRTLTESLHLYKCATLNVRLITPTGIQDQDIYVQHDTISIDYTFGDIDKLTNYESESSTRQNQRSQMKGQQTDQCFGCFSPRLPNAEKTFGIKKKFLEKSEIMDCHEKFKRLVKIFGPFDVNLFSTKQNKTESYQNITVESSTVKKYNDNNNANVEVRNLLSVSKKIKILEPIQIQASRKISSTQEQILVAVGMGNQRRTLQQKGLTDLALDLITSNTRSVKIKSKYYSTQKYFMDWRHGLGISGKFMKFLSESDLIKVTNNFINIKPIIDYFKILGPTNNLKTKELTTKTCCLIAVCGFLRASTFIDIIEKLVEIKAHSDEILCPLLLIGYISKELQISLVQGLIAIISIIAAKTDISTDAILAQAIWPSYYMFSSYYKLSSDLYSNITESVLSELT
ncbi:hypothetical protein BB561_001158 [Smittium simulii]|uniref:Uncharacterized protein n=1 Tax=Smittium simulii TaxID=133385 RepID=A0A2T9YW16_9FUNG|nr:hypothetical protein BB561_001158 [Smittium simulii]